MYSAGNRKVSFDSLSRSVAAIIVRHAVSSGPRGIPINVSMIGKVCGSGMGMGVSLAVGCSGGRVGLRR